MTNTELREELAEMLKNHPCNSKMCTYCKEMETCNFYEKSADHLIANGVTFAKDTDVSTKWISVRDRLPEDIRDVLVCHKLAGIGYCDRAWYDSDAKKWRSALSMNMKVTHWMPLPEPPKEEKT